MARFTFDPVPAAPSGRPLRILITSVGSLVGQNLLDVLEHRRERVHLIGTNTLAASPQNFRCDSVYLAPPTADAQAFEGFLRGLIDAEAPDLILAARDADTLFLARWRERCPELAGRIPYATAALAELSFDRWLSWGFAQAHALPFALSCRGDASSSELDVFCQAAGFPLVAKLLRDSDAAAVRLVRDRDELARLLAVRPGLLLQEYLGDPAPVLAALAELEPAPPLFYQAPDTWHCSCQSVMLGPNWVAPLFCSQDRHVLGRSEHFVPYADAGLLTQAEAYARALAAAGGLGPVNLQFRRDRHGHWKALAINLRMGGNTYSRWQSGYDELGLLLEAWGLPPQAPPATPGQVFKTLRNWFVPEAWLATLSTQGRWHAE